MNRPVKEPGQFLDLEIGTLEAEQGIPPDQFSNESPSRGQFFNPDRLRRVLIGSSRLVDDQVHLGQVRAHELNFAPDLGPLEASVPATQRRNCHRPNAPFANNLDEVTKPGPHPFDPRGLSPMPLGRKVDDPAGPEKHGVGGDEHLAHGNFSSLGRVGVGSGVGRKCLSEHEGNPLPHHPNLVDSVHQGLSRGLQ